MSKRPEILHDHDAFRDFFRELDEPADRVTVFTYMVGRNAPLDTFWRRLAKHNHEVYCGYSRDLRIEAHSRCVDLVMSFPLNVYLLPNCHSKVWSIYRNKTTIHYVGSYNLLPTHSSQTMVKLHHQAVVIPTILREKVTFNGNAVFAGVPFSSKATIPA